MFGAVGIKKMTPQVISTSSAKNSDSHQSLSFQILEPRTVEQARVLFEFASAQIGGRHAPTCRSQVSHQLVSLLKITSGLAEKNGAEPANSHVVTHPAQGGLCRLG
jgi:hypothetical protein